MHGKRVLLVDDDPALLRLVEYTLTEEGAQVITARNGVEGLRQFYIARPDLVLLDISMPEMDGWAACRSIRQMADIPIIMLTARGQNEDIIHGLELGADDYIVKPFSLDVLLARANAVMRRAVQPSVIPQDATYHDDWLTIRLPERRVIVNGEPVRLTATEFKLFSFLVNHAGHVITFQQLVANVWEQEYQDAAQQARLIIWRLRQKIERDPKAPRYITTEYGVGYRFERQPQLS